MFKCPHIFCHRGKLQIVYSSFILNYYRILYKLKLGKRKRVKYTEKYNMSVKLMLCQYLCS